MRLIVMFFVFDSHAFLTYTKCVEIPLNCTVDCACRFSVERKEYTKIQKQKYEIETKELS